MSSRERQKEGGVHGLRQWYSVEMLVGDDWWTKKRNSNWRPSSMSEAIAFMDRMAGMHPTHEFRVVKYTCHELVSSRTTPDERKEVAA